MAVPMYMYMHTHMHIRYIYIGLEVHRGVAVHLRRHALRHLHQRLHDKLGLGELVVWVVSEKLRLQLLYAVGHLALEMLDKVAREAQAERAIAHQRQPAHTADGLVPK